MQIEPAVAVPQDAIDRCLEAIEGRDPLTIPVEFADPDRAAALVAVDGDHGVIGVGWLRPIGEAQRVEVRVLPGHRRRGVGAALFTRLEAVDQALLASCDAGQHAVRRFLEARRFAPTGVIFVQRWDGDADDVPRAFRSAALVPAADPAAAARLLAAASVDAWPAPLFGAAELADPATRVELACIDGEPVGISAARQSDGAWTVGGLAVLPWARGRGVGRSLLCALMSAAAGEGLGVVLRASHDDERLVEWTRRLGFWTCRSWVTYQRPAGGMT